MVQPAAKTASGPIAIVAVEQNFPRNQRVIVDDFAHWLLPFAARVLVWMTRLNFARNWILRMTEKSFPGLWGAMICRKRYIDQKLIESVDKIDAVVNLGAGFDTRTYRLPALSGVPVWEVDLPENIERKRAVLRKVFGRLPEHLTLVGIDFDHQDPGAVLEARGFSLTKRTFFIWEAVTQYLTQRGVTITFELLAKAPAGSHLAFTYVRKDFLTGQNVYGQQGLYNRYVVRDKIWLFGMEPEGVASFLETYGWRVVEHLGYEELNERYVKPTGRQLAVMAIERMVYAEKL
jgi:methyltransferase (TIGR00027 family)